MKVQLKGLVKNGTLKPLDIEYVSAHNSTFIIAVWNQYVGNILVSEYG